MAAAGVFAAAAQALDSAAGHQKGEIGMAETNCGLGVAGIRIDTMARLP